jgi:hypothetical protein
MIGFKLYINAIPQKEASVKEWLSYRAKMQGCTPV